MRQAEAGEIDQRPRTQIVDKRQSALGGKLAQLAPGNRLGEAAHLVIARVHLHQQRGVSADGGGVIAQMGAVGGAGFAQYAVGARHDFGHAERAADFHQLAPGDDDFAPRGQGVEHEQHRRGIVVDHGGGLGAGEFAQRRLEMAVAVAAAA